MTKERCPGCSSCERFRVGTWINPNCWECFCVPNSGQCFNAADVTTCEACQTKRPPEPQPACEREANENRTSEAKAPSRECARCKQRVLSGECPHCGAWNDAVVLLPQAKLNTELIRKTLENRTNEAAWTADIRWQAIRDCLEICNRLGELRGTHYGDKPGVPSSVVQEITREIEALLKAPNRPDNPKAKIAPTEACDFFIGLNQLEKKTPEMVEGYIRGYAAAAKRPDLTLKLIEVLSCFDSVPR